MRTAPPRTAGIMDASGEMGADGGGVMDGAEEGTAWVAYAMVPFARRERGRRIGVEKAE
jgi:hypothetical protein